MGLLALIIIIIIILLKIILRHTLPDSCCCCCCWRGCLPFVESSRVYGCLASHCPGWWCRHFPPVVSVVTSVCQFIPSVCRISPLCVSCSPLYSTCMVLPFSVSVSQISSLHVYDPLSSVCQFLSTPCTVGSLCVCVCLSVVPLGSAVEAAYFVFPGQLVISCCKKLCGERDVNWRRGKSEEE